VATADRTTAPGASEDLRHVLDTARHALDREFQRAERYDAKARGQATLAGSWFTVAQAVAALSLSGGGGPGVLKALTLLFLALGAGSLFFLLRASARVWRLKTRGDVGPETLEAMAESAVAGDPDFGERTAITYEKILREARQANMERADALDPETPGRWFASATFWWWSVLAFGLAEMTSALLTRVLS
jgi:hypothetical protein